MQDLQTKRLIVGGSGSGADADVFPTVIRNLLPANIELISGYPGSNDILLAMERGEVDGYCGWSWSSIVSQRPGWLAEGKINILVQLALEKHPDLPDVPLVTEFVDRQDALMAMELILARQKMGRPYLAPPGIPAERREALRRAFDATTRDPAFRADAKRLQLHLNPITGEEIDTIIARIYGASESTVRLARHAIRKTRRQESQ